MSRATLSLTSVRFSYIRGGWNLIIPELILGKDGITSIIGPNGSGKSTLLRLVAGILRPQGGEVFLNGVPIRGVSRRRIAKHLGFLPQESPPLFDYTVEEVVKMGRYPHLRGLGILREKDEEITRQSLEAVDLAHLRQRPLSRLSGGERRRALIASVLAQEPKILILDEPTASLDIHHASSIMRLLSQLAHSGRAVVMATHDINLASLFSDRIIVIMEGRIIASGSPEAVLTYDLLGGIYGKDVIISMHPENSRPMVFTRIGC